MDYQPPPGTSGTYDMGAKNSSTGTIQKYSPTMSTDEKQDIHHESSENPLNKKRPATALEVEDTLLQSPSLADTTVPAKSISSASTEANHTASTEIQTKESSDRPEAKKVKLEDKEAQNDKCQPREVTEPKTKFDTQNDKSIEIRPDLGKSLPSDVSDDDTVHETREKNTLSPATSWSEEVNQDIWIREKDKLNGKFLVCNICVDKDTGRRRVIEPEVPFDSTAWSKHAQSTSHLEALWPELILKTHDWCIKSKDARSGVLVCSLCIDPKKGTHKRIKLQKLVRRFASGNWEQHVQSTLHQEILESMKDSTCSKDDSSTKESPVTAIESEVRSSSQEEEELDTENSQQDLSCAPTSASSSKTVPALSTTSEANDSKEEDKKLSDETPLPSSSPAPVSSQFSPPPSPLPPTPRHHLEKKVLWPKAIISGKCIKSKDSKMGLITCSVCVDERTGLNKSIKLKQQQNGTYCASNWLQHIASGCHKKSLEETTDTTKAVKSEEQKSQNHFPPQVENDRFIQSKDAENGILVCAVCVDQRTGLNRTIKLRRLTHGTYGAFNWTQHSKTSTHRKMISLVSSKFQAKKEQSKNENSITESPPKNEQSKDENSNTKSAPEKEQSEDETSNASSPPKQKQRKDKKPNKAKAKNKGFYCTIATPPSTRFSAITRSSTGTRNSIKNTNAFIGKRSWPEAIRKETWIETKDEDGQYLICGACIDKSTGEGQWVYTKNKPFDGAAWEEHATSEQHIKSIWPDMVLDSEWIKSKNIQGGNVVCSLCVNETSKSIKLQRKGRKYGASGWKRHVLTATHQQMLLEDQWSKEEANGGPMEHKIDKDPWSEEESGMDTDDDDLLAEEEDEEEAGEEEEEDDEDEEENEENDEEDETDANDNKKRTWSHDVMSDHWVAKKDKDGNFLICNACYDKDKGEGEYIKTKNFDSSPWKEHCQSADHINNLWSESIRKDPVVKSKDSKNGVVTCGICKDANTGLNKAIKLQNLAHGFGNSNWLQHLNSSLHQQMLKMQKSGKKNSSTGSPPNNMKKAQTKKTQMKKAQGAQQPSRQSQRRRVSPTRLTEKEIETSSKVSPVKKSKKPPSNIDNGKLSHPMKAQTKDDIVNIHFRRQRDDKMCMFTSYYSRNFKSDETKSMGSILQQIREEKNTNLFKFSAEEKNDVKLKKRAYKVYFEGREEYPIEMETFKGMNVYDVLVAASGNTGDIFNDINITLFTEETHDAEESDADF